MRAYYLVFVTMALGCASKQPPPASASPLDEGNHAFHTEYDHYRLEEEAQLGTSRPLITVSGPNATLKFAGQETRFTIHTDRYQTLKKISHVPVAVTAFMLALPPGPLSANDAARVAELKATTASVDRVVSPEHIGPDMVVAQHRILKETTALLDATASRGRPSEEELRAFGKAIRVDLLANVSAACRSLLEALHASVGQMRARVGDAAWSRALVFVATAHQARAREVSVQYFERLFGEHVAEGAMGEQRLVVTETKRDASIMVGAHLVDVRLGEILFDDASFMQWDLLAKFAKEHLDRLLPQNSSESR